MDDDDVVEIATSYHKEYSELTRHLKKNILLNDKIKQKIMTDVGVNLLKLIALDKHPELDEDEITNAKIVLIPAKYQQPVENLLQVLKEIALDDDATDITRFEIEISRIEEKDHDEGTTTNDGEGSVRLTETAYSNG